MDPLPLTPVPGRPPGTGTGQEPDAATPRRTRSRVAFAGLTAVLIVAFIAGAVLRAGGSPRIVGPATGARSGNVDLRITGSAPGTWDPALQGDASSATTLAQVFEGLTAFDAQSHVQPALAKSWSVAQGGRSVTFTLRSGIRFSDGTPIRAQDVVASWLRLIDPARPSPLASLLSDVTGADEYLRGTGPREGVAISAEGDTVVVRFRRPASYFVDVTSSPSLAVVPPSIGTGYASAQLPPNVVASGGYLPVSQTPTVLTLKANPNYWAGEPPLRTIEMVTDLEGQSATELFARGDLDYADLGASSASVLDWSWLRYDQSLGPKLRRNATFSTLYYGFTTTKPPFDDPLVRRAFAAAVDWDRLVSVGSGSSDIVATSLVPIGIPGRGDVDHSPRHDPDAARAALAAAGYPGGAGFPEVVLVSDGGFNEAIARELKEVLHVTVRVEELESSAYFRRLQTDPPPFWSLVWIADYPAPQDFLGLLLETGTSNNYGRWSNADFDAALGRAAATDDAAEQARWYAAAQEIVQRDVPVIPVSYGDDWALSAPDLLGADESGVGLIRFAGLSWSGR